MLSVNHENLIRSDTNIVFQNEVQRAQLPKHFDSLKVRLTPSIEKPLESLNLTFYDQEYVDSIETNVSIIHRTTSENNPGSANTRNFYGMFGLISGAFSVPLLVTGFGQSEDKTANFLCAGALLWLSYFSIARYFYLADEETTFTKTDTLRIWRSLKQATPISNQQITINLTEISKNPFSVFLDKDGSANVSLSDIIGEKLSAQTIGTAESQFGKVKIVLPQQITEHFVLSYIQNEDWSALQTILEDKDIPESVYKLVVPPTDIMKVPKLRNLFNSSI